MSQSHMLFYMLESYFFTIDSSAQIKKAQIKNILCLLSQNRTLALLKCTQQLSSILGNNINYSKTIQIFLFKFLLVFKSYFSIYQYEIWTILFFCTYICLVYRLDSRLNSLVFFFRDNETPQTKQKKGVFKTKERGILCVIKIRRISLFQIRK